jgi:tetratricopeptide (TPR) repeat protein
VGRIELLQSFIETSPTDPFPRYGLAIELKNLGKLDDAARAFADLIDKFPDYTPAYLHAGSVLVGLGQRDQAIAVYRAGIQACERKRDHHAKGEIEAALADLEANE